MHDYKTKTKKVWLAWMVGISLFGFGAVGAESGSICINGQNPEHPYNIDGDVNHNINVLDVVGLLGAIEGRNTTVCGNVNGDLKPDGTERVDILDLVSWLRWRENPTPLIDGEAEVEITSPGKSEDPVREIEAITWGGVKHATNYQLYFAKADEPDTPIMVPLPEADQLTYDLPNDGTFEPGVTYIVRIRGLDEDRNGTSIMGNEYGFEVTDSYQIEEEDQDDPRAQKSPFEDSPIIMTESEAQVSFSPGMKGVWERMGYWGDQLMTNVTGSPQKVRGEMTVVADRLCLYERRENHGDHFFDTYISVPEAYTGTIPAITDELYTINLGASGVAYDQLTEAIEQDDCVIGLTNITRSAGVVMDDVLEIPGGALGGEDYDYFEALDYDRSTKDWFGQNIDQRLGRHITVAVLDTGVDFGNTGAFPRGQFESFVGGNFPYFPGANMSAYLYGSNPGGELPDEPRDTIGHGTAVTKIITDINPYAKILPIKIAANDSQLEQVSPQKLYEIIRRSTNMGADVVNMSFNAFTGSRGMCHPLVGHAIYKSIEKDVFFVSAAGNGIKIDANGVEIPGELKHVSDFGPAEYGDNAYPACWGKYFKGMMTVSSLDRGKNLDFFSNHGEPVEIATFGTNVKSIGLGSNAERIYSGTSFSAPQISAAVALTKGWLRKRNLPEDPWFVEDVLLTALNQSRSGNLEGKITGNRTLDLGALKIYLDYLDQVSPAQVRFLPSIPYRTGEGWRPDRDRDYHEGIIISADTNPLLPGNSTQMKASLLLEAATGNLPEVTSETFWTSSDPQKAPVNVRTGEVSFASDKTGSVNIIGHYKGLEDSEVVEVFVEEGKEGYRLERLQVKFEDALLREDGLLELPWYEQDIPFEVQSVYTHVTSPEGNPDIIENILSEVEIESSVPDELQLLEHNKGHLNTVETYGGEDYALTFRYRGREKIVPIYIQPRAYIDQEIHSPLGLAVHESQDVIYQYRLTLEGEVIPVPFRADWRPVSPELARDEVMVPVQNSREQYIDATKLPLGFYTIGVDVFYKGNGRDPITRGPQIIQDEFTFEVTDRFEHLEVLTKRQFLEVGQRGLMELRIYHDPENNSHETIANPPVEMAFDAENAAEIDFRALGLPREDDIITWSTELDYPRGAGTELYIDRQGIVYPDQNALALGNDGQGVPTRYIVKAIFEGETVERKITITPFDVVTGAESEVAYIRILGKDEIIPDVFQWGKGNVGLYNLDGEFAHPAVYNLPDAFHNNYYLWVYYDDGRIRNKTSVASFSANDPRVQKRGVNYFSIPFTESSGGSVTITAFYSEGAGVSHQTAITLPVTTHEFKSLDLSARITPGGVLFAQNNQGVNLWANAYDADAPYQAYLVGYVEFYTPDKTQYYRSNEVLNIDVSSQNSLWSTSHETLESVGNFSVSGGSQLLYPIVQGERGALEPVFNPDELVGAHIRGIYKGDVIPEIIEGDMQVQMDFDIIDEVDRKVDFQVIPGTGTFLIEGNWLYLVEDNIGVRPKEIYARSDGGPVNTRHPDIEHEENYNYSWQDDQGQLDPPDTYGSFTAIQHWGDQDPVRILTYQATNQNEFEGLSREVSRYVMGMTDFDAGPKPTPPIETALAERVDDPICFGHSPDPSSSNFDPDFDQWDLGDFAGGTGFPDDPYLICTVGQLRNHQEIAREKILAEDTRNGSRYRGGPGRCDIPGDWSHLQEDWERVRYCHRNHFKLMANLDFITEGNSLEPIKIRNLDGNGYQIRNFSSIEETGEASVFRSKDYMNIRNLILKNIYLKGQQAGVFSARGITPLQRVVFEDVHLLDSQVWGEFNTGGFISVTKSAVIIEGSSVRDTDIAFERGNAGGFIGKAWDGSGGGAIIRDSFVKANLELAGVQGNYAYVGGLVGDMQKTTLLESDVGIRNPLDLDRIELHPGYASQFIDRGIYNSFFEGEITTGHSLQDERSRSGVGGLVGLNGPAPIVHSFTRNAYIVTSGAKAGGLVGESMANSRYWYHGVMAHNKVIGGAIWGGSGQRESFEGGLELPGPSNAGGIVGLSHGGMILDNEVSCTTIKGVTNVGGVVGKADSYKHRIYRNTSSAKVRSSEGFHGGFIGSAPQEVRQDFPNGQTYEKRIFFEDNDWDTVNAPSVEDLGLLRASNEKPVLGVHNAFGVNTDYREVCPTDVGL